MGAFQMQHFGRVDHFEQKTGPADLVSFVDKQSEQMFTDAIHAVFPDDEILGEETYDPDRYYRSAKDLWIIDPIDGTTPYLYGIPYFAIAVAYVRDGVPELAAVHMPALGELYFADETGAYCGEEKISPSKTSTIAEALVDISPYWFPGIKEDIDYNTKFRSVRGTMSLYTAACSLCYTASGKMDGGFLGNCGGVWDFLPGGYILQQAGGKLSQLDGSPWDPFVNNCLYTNGVIHDEFASFLAN